MDSLEIVYVTEPNAGRIRAIFPNRTVITLAGGGISGERGYVDGVGKNARFSLPYGISLGLSGIVYVADAGNNSNFSQSNCNYLSYW